MSRALAVPSVLVWLMLLIACGPAAPAIPSQSSPPVAAPTQPPAAATDVPSADQPLLPNPDASATLGDTVRMSGGEFVGDQADVTVEQAVAGPTVGGSRQYAFLVLIIGRDAETFPYNLRDFRLFDDLDFAYEPLPSGGKTPRLEFGDLGPGQQVRGWLTFEASASTTNVDLQYSPALALEPAAFSFRVP